jgi:ribosomal protein S18 acetylase RimI-like enzyme
VSSTPSPAEIRALERVAYDLWVAPETEELDGWILRAAHGLTGRANSVWANGDGALPLAERLDRAEAWYASRSLPARFQVTDGSRPAGLESALAARGYRRGYSTSVQTAHSLPRTEARPEVELAEEPDDGWIALWQGERGFGRPDVAHALLTGSPGTTAFARIDGEAVGRAVAVGGWLGLTSMATVPAARRRGRARAIVDTLLAWGRANGCTRAVLQVEVGNEAAHALYRRYGFAEHHAYRYLVAP